MLKNLLYMLFGIFIGVSAVIVGLYIVMTEKQTTPECINEIYINDPINISTQVTNIVTKVANAKEYKIHKYDCTDFSRDLVNNLSEINVSSYCVFGYKREDKKTLHTWVGINAGNLTLYIEATDGTIIDNTKIKPIFSKNQSYGDYILISKGKCV